MARSAIVVLLLAAVAVGLASAQAGNLLVAKSFRSDFFVQNRNLEIEYRLHNVGDGPVYSVTLKDENWDPEFFTLVSGSFEGTINEIAPGENATVAFTVLPLAAETFIDKPTYFQYLRVADGEPTTAQTAAGGQFTVLTEAEYHAKYATHTTEWLIVGVLVLLAVGAPFVVSNNIENTLNRKDK